MQNIDEKNAKLLGTRIKSLRKKTGLSLNAFVLGREGLTTATWSRVENGLTDVKLSTLIKISSVLNLTIDELVKGIDFDYTIVDE